MPNHFHFLIQVKEKHSSDNSKSSDEYYSKQISKQIAVLLRSYTRAINKQENRIGSLFQQKTKAKCLNEITKSYSFYASTCFQYIHQNPLEAKIVKSLESWEYSSFLDYAGIRNGTLCNQDLAFEIINFDRDNFIKQSYSIIEEKKLKGIWD